MLLKGVRQRLTDFDIIFEDSDYRQIIDDHEEGLAEKTRERVEKKRRQLELADSFRNVTNRFWNNFGYNGAEIVEMKVRYQSKNHRAFFVFVQESGDLVFLDVVEKEGDFKSSDQYQLLQGVKNNAGDVMDYARDRVLRRCSQSSLGDLVKFPRESNKILGPIGLDTDLTK